MLDMWLGGIQGLLQFKELAFLALGMFIRLFFGAIPGLGGAAALALLMPLTYGLEPFTDAAVALAEDCRHRAYAINALAGARERARD